MANDFRLKIKPYSWEYFAKILRTERKKCNLSMRQVCFLTGIRETRLNNWELGYVKPSIDVYFALLDFYKKEQDKSI